MPGQMGTSLGTDGAKDIRSLGAWAVASGNVPKSWASEAAAAATTAAHWHNFLANCIMQSKEGNLCHASEAVQPRLYNAMGDVRYRLHKTINR